MTIEEIIYQVLSPLFDGRVYPDVAPDPSETPRAVYQQVGGAGFQFTEGTIPDRENCRMQIAVWGTRRVEVTQLAKLVEEAILTAPQFQAEALGSRNSVHEPDTNLYGARQDFSIWVTR